MNPNSDNLALPIVGFGWYKASPDVQTHIAWFVFANGTEMRFPFPADSALASAGQKPSFFDEVYPNGAVPIWQRGAQTNESD